MASRRLLSDYGLMAIPLLVTLLAGAGLIALSLRLATLVDETGGTLVAVFPPSTSADEIFAAVLRADGRLVNSTLLDFAWIVHSDRDGFVARLKSHGAWRAFEPSLFQPVAIAGCFLVVPPIAPTR